MCLGCGAACAALLRCALLLPLVALIPPLSTLLKGMLERHGVSGVDHRLESRSQTGGGMRVGMPQ